jgi:hypothetical protein
LQNLRTTYKLKLPHPAEGGADQAAASERQKKKKQTLPNHLARLQQSFCLNTNTRTGCGRRNTRTQTKTEILLFPNLEFVCLFVLFLVCSYLHSEFFRIFFFLVSFTIVNWQILNYTQIRAENTHTHLATNPIQPQNKIKPRERKQVTETTN